MPSRVEDFLKSLGRFGIKPGLERISTMMKWSDDPHRAFPSLLIGGTNGKGSVVAFLSAILSAAGYRVGTYTSPHLISYRERFRIDGVAIAPDRLDELLEWASPLVERLGRETPYGAPTEFEVLTAVAFRYFAEEGVDIAVVEVGLGGRWDATNILDPMISVITTIQLDHTDRLGHDHLSIAKEKLGIARPHRPLVTAERKPLVLRLFEETATRLDARLICVGREVTFRLHKSAMDGTTATFTTWRKGYTVTLKMIGTHQLANFGCALAVVESLRDVGWGINEEAIVKGASEAFCPGRLQLLRLGVSGPLLVLDGAHNPAGAFVLARALRTLFCYRRLLLVFGILRDKEAFGVATALIPLADWVFVTAPKTERAMSPKRLAEICRPLGKPLQVIPEVSEAVQRALTVGVESDLVCVTGSLYVVGEALEALGVKVV